MHRLALLVNSTAFMLETVFVSEEGMIEGVVEDALVTAGLAGQLCCFPQPNGGNWLYGFRAYLPEAPGYPRFWVLLPNLDVPEVNLLRPLSWAKNFPHMSVMSAADFAAWHLRKELQKSYPDWQNVDMVSRLSMLAEVFSEEPWFRFISDVVPSYEMGETETLDGKIIPRGFIPEIVIGMFDGSKLTIDRHSPWPKVMQLGTVKITRLFMRNCEVVPEDKFFDYEMDVSAQGISN